MKLKNFLIEFGYWLGMILGLIFLARSCAELSYAQQRLSAKNNYHVLPATPDSGYVIYYRNDSLFAKLSDGREVYLNISAGNYKPANNFTLEVIPQNGGTRFDADSIIIRDKAKEFGWVTDSIKWVPAGGMIIFDGEEKCRDHDWAYETSRKAYFGYHEGSKTLFGDTYIRMRCDQVNPDGKHCNEHQSATREKICRKCLRSEIEREWWFQHFVAPPKSEFQKLKEKQRVKK